MGVIGLALYLLPVLIWLVRSVKVFKKLPFKGYPGQAIVVMLWLVLIALAVAITYFGVRAYLSPELLFGFSSGFSC